LRKAIVRRPPQPVVHMSFSLSLIDLAVLAAALGAIAWVLWYFLAGGPTSGTRPAREP
jgi:hypothetical protein